ncbi:MAG TPA: nickel pincer cofactor biosynthesis protein LarC [Polyangiales bacterium]|nr:nickel pincer cofactor biosynthesis protein LarC [Polyangiales bacterium]
MTVKYTRVAPEGSRLMGATLPMAISRRRCAAAPAEREPLAPAAGSGGLLFFDAGSGLAGDMIVAALVDLGVPEAVIQSGLAGLALSGYRARFEYVFRSSLRARRFVVDVDEKQPSRDYQAIVELLQACGTLSDGARALALRAFEKLGLAEAQIHGTTLARVHFHEVGAVDSIVDICGAAIALDYLGARVACSPLPMGRGSTRSAHGSIPLPAPATLLCLAGVPTYDAQLAQELVTPTGACLVASAVQDWVSWPGFRPQHVGMGAGTKEFPDRPNVLRAILGTPDVAATLAPTRRVGSHTILEANIDDMTAEVAAFAVQRAFDAGALDVWTTPIGMKKSRPGVTLSALTANEHVDDVVRVLLSETTTLGVRYHAVDRVERNRRKLAVETPFGSIELKVADGDGLPANVAPEYESCRRAAEQHKIPIRRVYNAALAAYFAQHSGD